MDQLTNKDAEKSSWPKGVAAITLFVEDLEAAKQFYQAAFAMPVMFEDSDAAVFKFGNTLVNLLKTSAAVELVEPAKVGGRDGGPRQVFTLEVDDVDAIDRKSTRLNSSHQKISY